MADRIVNFDLSPAETSAVDDRLIRRESVSHDASCRLLGPDTSAINLLGSVCHHHFLPYIKSMLFSFAAQAIWCVLADKWPLRPRFQAPKRFQSNSILHPIA